MIYILLIISISINLYLTKDIIINFIKKIKSLIDYIKMDKQDKLMCKCIDLAYLLNDDNLKTMSEYYLAELDCRKR